MKNVELLLLLLIIVLTSNTKKEVSTYNQTFNNNSATIVDHPIQEWFPTAPSLPEPKGEVLKVTSVSQLYQAVDVIKPGGTIVIGNGFYQMTRGLVIREDDIIIRSENDDRTKVILDFNNSIQDEGIIINSKTGFTRASLTVQNVTQNGIKFNSNLGVDRVTIYNVVSHNVWQRHIKGPHGPRQK